MKYYFWIKKKNYYEYDKLSYEDEKLYGEYDDWEDYYDSIYM